MTEKGLLERLHEDFPPVKTIEQNAAEMEFRYRALVCRTLGSRRLGSGTPDQKVSGVER